MFESASALFSIADAGEFRFARFYIVCEEVPLGTPESPLIVCDLSDTLRECPNVEETRNSMQTFNRKKCSHFSPTNIPSAFPSEIGRMYFLSYSLAHQKGTACFKRQSLFSFRYMLRHARLIHTFHRSSALFYGNNLCQISWLIYIESLVGRHIVREQLQCHRCRQHHELILHIRQRENFVLLR